MGLARGVGGVMVGVMWPGSFSGCAAAGWLGGLVVWGRSLLSLGCSAELGEAADVGEDGPVGVGPWPFGGQAKDHLAAVVHDPSGQSEQAGADSVPVGQCLSDRLGVVLDPPVQVVSEGGAGKPGCVGEEVPRRTVRQPGMFFEVPYGQLRSGMGPVETVCYDRGQFGVGGERMISPVGP